MTIGDREYSCCWREPTTITAPLTCSDDNFFDCICMSFEQQANDEQQRKKKRKVWGDFFWWSWNIHDSREFSFSHWTEGNFQIWKKITPTIKTQRKLLLKNIFSIKKHWVKTLKHTAATVRALDVLGDSFSGDVSLSCSSCRVSKSKNSANNFLIPRKRSSLWASSSSSLYHHHIMLLCVYTHYTLYMFYITYNFSLYCYYLSTSKWKKVETSQFFSFSLYTVFASTRSKI